MKITYGITGNYYAIADQKHELISLCDKIGKSPSSIKWYEKYRSWVFRAKCKKHKERLKEISDS